jgi:hypothetical protein
MKAEKVLKIISSSFVRIAIILLIISVSIGCSNSSSDDPTRSDVRFTDMGDGTVIDEDSGLIWLKDADALGMENWDNAKTAAATLDEGDFDWLTDGSSEGDWRIPTQKEWEAFVDTNYFNPALSNAAGTSKWTEGDAFNNVKPRYYWSSTEFNTNVARSMSMLSGSVGYDFKDNIYYVWPVLSDN